LVHRPRHHGRRLVGLSVRPVSAAARAAVVHHAHRLRRHAAGPLAAHHAARSAGALHDQRRVRGRRRSREGPARAGLSRRFRRARRRPAYRRSVGARRAGRARDLRRRHEGVGRRRLMSGLVEIQLLNGIVQGMIYALVAAGLTLIFGMLDIPNFAHGAFYALGAYVAFTIVSATGNFWLAIAIVPIVVAVIGLVVDAFAMRRLARAGHVYQILFTLGLVLIVQEVI